MGIVRATIKLLMREGNRERFSGHVLTIGRQDVSPVTFRDLQGWARKMDFHLKSFSEVLPTDKKAIKDSLITDDLLFLLMGFNAIDSLDYSNFEKCTITHDLNTDVPDNLYNKYDLIFDGGATEHIFNVPKVLENYNKMLKAGGRIIHALPSNNYVDHGFYLFSPTLFWDYYSANNWEIKDSLFMRHRRDADKCLWDIYIYSPHCLDTISYGSLNKSICDIFFVVKKTDKSTFDASVQQGLYLERWKGELNTRGNSWKKKIVALLPRRLKIVLRPFYLYVFSKIPLSFILKRIGRY